MEFRICNMNDLDSVAAFYEEVVEYLEANINYPKWTKDYPNRESVKEAIKNRTQYICLDNDEIVGAVVYNTDPGGDYKSVNWSKNIEQGKYHIIHTFAVAPNLARRGVGCYMIDKCISISQKLKFEAIRLDVVPDNIPAKKLYEKKGFKYVGTLDLNRGIKEIPVFDLYELNL